MAYFLSLFCKIGFHKMQEKSHPVVGRRNLGNGSYGPEETFIPGDGFTSAVPRFRDCLRCGKREILFRGRWE